MSAELAILVAAATLTSTSAVETSSIALSTEIREEVDAYDDLPLLVLRTPEVFTELLFSPLIPVMLVFEKLRLHERIFDLLTNEERTFAVLPIFDFTNRSGLSGGLAIVANDPLGSADRTIITGIYRENGDRSLSFSYGLRLPSLSGRRFACGASYELDEDRRWFGAGGETKDTDERALGERAVGARASIQLPSPVDWEAQIEIGFNRYRLYEGTSVAPPVRFGDDVAPPPGFGRTLTYPRISAELSYDTRDSNARPTRGFVFNLKGSGTHDANEARTGGIAVEAQAGVYLPLLPLNRVLLLTAGFAGAAPLGNDASVPFHQLLELGGSTRLRGYTSDRFMGLVGWWSSAEYRYHIFRYLPTDTIFSGTVFLDAGRVGNEVGELVSGPIAWSVGLGFRLELNLLFLGRFQVAYSPEGFRFVVGLNELI